MNNINLGALYKKDKRDFKLGSYQTPVALPDTFIQDLSPLKKLYQNGWPACGAHAGAMFKMIQEFLQNGEAKTFSPDYLWINIKQIDGYPLDAGTDMISIFKTLQTKGVCDYDMLPNNYSLGLIEYSNPQRLSSRMDEDAKPKGIKAYAFSETDLRSLKQAVYQNKAVLVLAYVDDGFFGTRTPTFTQKKYGHFYIIHSFGKDRFYLIDSTESDLTKSDKEILFKDIKFIRQAGTAIDLPSDYIFTTNLRLGMRSNDVKELQKRLGMSVENQTGYFGTITFGEVRKYQKSHGILSTGFVGELTRRSLNLGRN